MSNSTLVFLPGFLGSQKDWDPLIELLELPSLAVDLSLDLEDFLLSFEKQVILVGYSMGGRIALALHHRYPKRFPHLILLSTHLGFQSEEEKLLKYRQDAFWKQALTSLPLPLFLKQWYAQDLFSSLTEKKELFKDVLARRYLIDPMTHLHLLEKHPLAPYKAPASETLLLYGERDLKYAQQYSTLNKTIAIADAGHAIHIENPRACSQHIKEHYAYIHSHKA